MRMPHPALKGKLLLFFLWMVVFISPGKLRARGHNPFSHPIFAAASAGAFRLSAERFNRYYSSPWGFLPGAQIGFGFSPSAFLVLKGAYFRKSNRTHSTWRQHQFEAGFRRYSVGFSAGSRTYMGFGLAFFHIQESSGTFLKELGEKTTEVWPKGFYIEIGYEHPVISHLSFILHFDLSTAGMVSGPTLQRQSLGGFSASSGLKYQIF